MKASWQRKIINNFNEASLHYDNDATLQRMIAKQIATECYKRKISKGIWVDLGTGTGLLADALEELHPTQSVLRVDASEMMLAQHAQKSFKTLWDLNHGLPPDLSQPPTLIASSFVLHWLNNPKAKLQEWFSAIAPGGWLALAIPVEGCFPEWHKAASLAKVSCTAIDFPCHEELINSLDKNKIEYQRLERITQEAHSVNSLLKPLIKIGAQATHHNPLKISDWKNIQKAWPISPNTYKRKLTWLVQILLVQK